MMIDGADLSGLGPDGIAHATDYVAMPSLLENPEGSAGYLPEDDIAAGMETHWLYGSESSPGLGHQASSNYIAASVTDVSAMLAAAGSGDDVVELCGGEARVTTLAVRRRLTSGGCR